MKLIHFFVGFISSEWINFYPGSTLNESCQLSIQPTRSELNENFSDFLKKLVRFCAN